MRNRTYLHPEEESSGLWLDLKKVDTVFSLFDLLKLGHVWEENELFDCILLGLVEECEGHHSWLERVTSDLNPALGSVWSHHTTIIVHAACSEFTKRGRSLREATSTCTTELLEQCLHLSLIHLSLLN